MTRALLATLGLLTAHAAHAACADAFYPQVAGPSALSLVIKASAGILYDVYAFSTANGYLMVFNAASVPANGPVTIGAAAGNLVECVAVSAGSAVSINYGWLAPEAFSSGMTAVFSSTGCGTLTASAAAFLHGRAF